MSTISSHEIPAAVAKATAMKKCIFSDSVAYMRGIRKGLRMNLAELEEFIAANRRRFGGLCVASNVAPLAVRRMRCKHLFYAGMFIAHEARTKRPVRCGKAPCRPSAKTAFQKGGVK